MNDTTTSLYEHIRNRLATGYGYGNDQQVVTDDVPDHRTSSESIREDYEGDVGIFEYYTTYDTSQQDINHSLWASNIQISVVVKNGLIEKAIEYLLASYKNINTDMESSNVIVKNTHMLNCAPVGKNGAGKQMVVMNIKVFYYKYIETLDESEETSQDNQA